MGHNQSEWSYKSGRPSCKVNGPIRVVAHHVKTRVIACNGYSRRNAFMLRDTVIVFIWLLY